MLVPTLFALLAFRPHSFSGRSDSFYIFAPLLRFIMQGDVCLQAGRDVKDECKCVRVVLWSNV